MVVSAAPNTSRICRMPFHSSQVRRLAEIVERVGGQRDEVGIGAQRRADREPVGVERPLARLVFDQQPAQRRRRVGRDHLVLLPERVDRDVGQVREPADRL